MDDSINNAYLNNPICHIKPLFNINYENKKDIISCALFKIANFYKSFDMYIDGLENLYKYLARKFTR